MRKGLLSLFFALLAAHCSCLATDHDPLDDILAVINMKPTGITQDKVSSLLGQPEKIEDKKKEAIWHYTIANSALDIYWSAHETEMQKISFTHSLQAAEVKQEWDNSLTRKLVSGQTALTDALKLLGAPADMQIKQLNQELHYKYQRNVLNLFFRKGTLVNYTLY